MTQAEIGVGVQGAGWVSTEHIRAYQNNPHTRVVAIGSRTREGAQRKAEQTGVDVPVFDRFEDLLAHPEVDLVSLCTPPERHAEETIQAAQAGKHILIEKPVALDPADLPRMQAAVQAAGVRTAVCFVLRWNPAFANIQALKAEGLLGSTYFVQTDYWNPQDKAAEGAMLGGGCHAMDAARYLMGSDVVEVTALRSGEPGPAPHAGAPDTVALVRFADGGMGKVSALTSQAMPYHFNIDLFGTDGVVRGDRVYTAKLPGLTGMAHLPTVLPDSGDVTHHPFPQTIGHLVDCVRAGKESHVNLADAINTHEACFAADLSAAQGGRPVRLPLA